MLSTKYLPDGDADRSAGSPREGGNDINRHGDPGNRLRDTDDRRAVHDS
jgi:hypothetical protein